ncbi:MAG TPA: hypothetical protein PKN44_08035 [Bacteroidales bacterium]|nr:hypothetical protein [Bacteroidales bacterium]HPS51781.1 hypothetical protein [Bacteroidales bacterium]
MKKYLFLICYISLACALFAQTKKPGYNLYQDPNGFFSVIKPDGWNISSYTETSRGKVKFLNPRIEKMNIIIIGEPNPYENFEELLRSSRNSDTRMKEKYQSYDVTLSSKQFTIDKIQYISTTITLKKMNKKMLLIDFIQNNTHFTINYTSTIATFESSLPVVYDCIYSISTSTRKFTEQNINNALVESKIKQAQFNMQMGLNDYALKYIEEGLIIDPGNKKLMDLKSKLTH